MLFKSVGGGFSRMVGETERNLKSESGNAILLVTMLLSVVTVSFFIAANVIVQDRNQTTSNVKVVETRFALNSLADFLVFAVRQGWCFNQNLMNEPKANCTLSHARNTKRIFMSNDEYNFIRELITANPNSVGAHPGIDNILLESFEMTVPLDGISTIHPLAPVLSSLKTFSAIHIKIERDTSAYLPRTGGESFVTITTSLVDQNGQKPARLFGSSLQVISRITVYKRELNTFALVVARDLRLDVGSITKGDAAIPTGGSPNAPGIVFKSPVFVNGNVVLPALGYTPVSFMERVYLGRGKVMTGNLPFEPASPGSENDRRWTDGTPKFGGFLNGIQIDGDLDKGLITAFWGTQPKSSDADLMKLCINRNLYLSDANQLKYSQIYADITGPNSYTQVGYRVAWTGRMATDEFPPEANQFRYQDLQRDVRTVSMNNWTESRGDVTTTLNSSDKRAVGNFAVIYGDDDVYSPGKNENGPEFDMTAAETVVVKPDLSEELKAEAAAKLASMDSSQTKYKNLEQNYENMEQKWGTPAQQSAKKSQYESEIASLQSEIKTNQDSRQYWKDKKAADEARLLKPGLTSSQRDAIEDDIREDNQKIAFYNDQISDKNDAIENRQDKINTINWQMAQMKIVNDAMVAQANDVAVKQKAYNDQVAYNSRYRRPEISLTTAEVATPNFSGPQPHLLDVKLDVKNAEFLVNAKQQPLNLRVRMKGYDATYAKGNSILDPKKGPYSNQSARYIDLGKPAGSPGFKISPAPALAIRNQGQVNPFVQIPEDTYVGSWGKLQKDCTDLSGAKGSQSFGGAAWNIDFSSQTRSSWNFKGETNDPTIKDPVLSKIEFHSGSSSESFSAWRVRSIVGTCEIQSSATVVTGFFMCDELVIRSRTKPLKIIGTFIVGKLTIDPSALTHGISWSSIYYPPATYDLRKAKALAPISDDGSGTGVKDLNRECPDSETPQDPIWNPYSKIENVSDRYACNAISLRASANPFQWTSVNPDCGILPGVGGVPQSNTSCKRHPVNFYVVEYSREAGL